MIRFVLLALTLSALVMGAVGWGVDAGWVDHPSFAWEIIIFLFVTHVAGYNFVVRQLDQRPEDFVKVYLGLTVIRILFFGIFIFVVIWIEPNAGSSNAVFFLVSYVLFTGLEVGALYRVVSSNDPTKRGQKGL